MFLRRLKSFDRYRCHKFIARSVFTCYDVWPCKGLLLYSETANVEFFIKPRIVLVLFVFMIRNRLNNESTWRHLCGKKLHRAEVDGASIYSVVSCECQR